jgi:DNA recombination protein RmuC
LVLDENLLPLAAIGVAALLVLLVLGVARGERSRAATAAERVWAAQAELAGRLQQLSENQAAAQAQLNRTLEARLDSVAKRLGDGLTLHAQKTGDGMTALRERLAVIDSAQKNITKLSEQVVSLQDILSNKQARGAHGQTQMENLVRDVLPPSAYVFQAKLGNNRMADCLLKLPNPPGSIVVDAKYPLESYRALREARDDAARIQAERAFSADILRHVRDIAERYIVPGETAESALMFVPSEAVFAEIHAGFQNVVEESFRRRVWIVSPTTLWATLNTLRGVLRDVSMREQAGLLQAEMQNLLSDMARLDDRVGNLRKHFDLAGRDIEGIGISTEKVIKRATRIDDMQLGEETATGALPPPADQT